MCSPAVDSANLKKYKNKIKYYGQSCVYKEQGHWLNVMLRPRLKFTVKKPKSWQWKEGARKADGSPICVCLKAGKLNKTTPDPFNNNSTHTHTKRERKKIKTKREREKKNSNFILCVCVCVELCVNDMWRTVPGLKEKAGRALITYNSDSLSPLHFIISRYFFFSRSVRFSLSSVFSSYFTKPRRKKRVKAIVFFSFSPFISFVFFQIKPWSCLTCAVDYVFIVFLVGMERVSRFCAACCVTCAERHTCVSVSAYAV